MSQINKSKKDSFVNLNDNTEKNAGARWIPELNKEMVMTFNYIKHSSKHPIRRWMVEGFYKQMLRDLSDLQINSILDAGCGEGYTLDRLLKADIGLNLTGVDYSRAAVNLGKELFPELDLKVGNIYNLQFGDDSEDLVICTEVLEHLEYPRRALGELVRVSQKYLVLSVPHEPFFSLKNLLIGRNIMRLGSSKGHVNWWTTRAFHRFVNEEKVNIIKSRHPFPFTLLIIEKL